MNRSRPFTGKPQPPIVYRGNVPDNLHIFRATDGFINLGDLRTDFQRLDADGDGFIFRLSLEKMLVARGLDAAIVDRHVRAFSKICVNRSSDGRLSYKEFFQEYLRMQIFKALQCIKKMFGKEGGRADITRAELNSAMCLQLGQVMADEQTALCFAEADRHGRGRVSIRGLEAWYNSCANHILQAREAVRASRPGTSKSTVSRWGNVTTREVKYHSDPTTSQTQMIRRTVQDTRHPHRLHWSNTLGAGSYFCCGCSCIKDGQGFQCSTCHDFDLCMDCAQDENPSGQVPFSERHGHTSHGRPLSQDHSGYQASRPCYTHAHALDPYQEGLFFCGSCCITDDGPHFRCTICLPDFELCPACFHLVIPLLYLFLNFL
jgi:Ca2+-binding EF-hand superfamily protein